MSKLRFRVVETAFKKKAATVEIPAERPCEYFAKYVFNREKMFKYLPSAVYAKLTDAMDNSAPLERAIADEVAAGMGFIVFKVLDKIHGLRVPKRIEEEGLDIYEHGESAYN